MEGSHLANLEAVLTIAANLIEIVWIFSGGMLSVLFWVPKAFGIPDFSRKLFLHGLALTCLGFFFPSITKAIANATSDLEAVLAWGALILWLIVSIWLAATAYFLPSYLAVRVRKKERKLWIIALNVMGFIPLAWLVAYFWACMPEKSMHLRQGPIS